MQRAAALPEMGGGTAAGAFGVCWPAPGVGRNKKMLSRGHHKTLEELEGEKAISSTAREGFRAVR